eukprot:Opistho-1_new@6302
MRGLGSETVGAGLRHLDRDLMQFGRVEADHARQRLAMGEAAVGAHQIVGMLGRDLDMIAEHAVMLDLERGDAGALLIVGLQRGDGAAATGARVTQIVERGIVPLGDIAAIGGIDRRRGDERALEQVDQRAMAAQLGRKRGEQCGRFGKLAECLTQPPCTVETVAQLAEIARAATAGGEAADGAADIGERPQRGAQIVAQAGLVMEALDEIEPRLDRIAIHQRRGDIGAEQARARAGDGAIDRIEQAALAGAGLALGQLEAFARRGVDRHAGVGTRDTRRAQKGQGALGGMFEIGDEPAGGGQRGATELAEAVERGDVEQPLEARLAAAAVELAARTVAGDVECVAAVGGDDFGRIEPGECGADRVGRAFENLEPAGRDVGGGDRGFAARLADRGAPVGGAAVEQRFLGQRARCDDADDRAGDQRLGAGTFLGLFGRFDLVGDGDTLPGLDQAGEIAVHGVRGDAAHRDLLTPMFAARGERDVEDAAGALRIVEEQLIEIAHAIEEHAIGRFGLEREILRHHRGGSGVGHYGTR